MKLVLTEFVTLDGVSQGPGSPTEDTSDGFTHGGWYVVTITLTEGSWRPTTVLRGDPVQTVGELEAQPGRELQIQGSARLGNALLAAGLVDTLRLVVAPP